MTQEQALAAIGVGAEVLSSEANRGLDVVCLGEIGIGNTTAASAIVASITGLSVSEVTGRGTGIDAATWMRKLAVIERAIELQQPDPALPLDVLAKVGGFEIAGLVGVTLAAASRRIAVVVDGFIATAAALVAVELCPRVRSFLPVNSAILGQARESQTSSSLGWSDERVNHFVIQGCAQSVATSNGTSFRHDPSRGFPRDG